MNNIHKFLGTFILLMAILFSACQTTTGATKSVKKASSPTTTDTMSAKKFKSTVLSRYWELVGIQTDSGFLDIMPEHGGGGIIRFYETSRFESSSGLNTSIGTWKYFRKVADNMYRFEILGIKPTTNLGENNQETKFDKLFFSALSKTSYLLKGNQTITLLDKNKNPILKFFSN